MADEGSATPVAAAPAAQLAESETKTPAVEDLKLEDTPAEPVGSKDDEPKATPAEEKPAEPESKPDTVKQDEDAAKPTQDATEKPADNDVEMKDAPDTTAAEDAAVQEKPEAASSAPAGNAAAAATPKSKAPSRRKSTAGADSAKGKKLNKKASRAQITHIDAKPGDHYFIKLKGFPQWPCIICDEDMLPTALLKTRPVSAAREDGSYRDDFADGGKQAANRSFPIMYLATNEFGWVSNKDLIDLDPAKVMDHVGGGKMRKDLILAHELAQQHHDLDYYKEVLQQFQEEMIERQKAAEAKAAAAAAAKASKKKAKAPAVDDDLEMEDFDDELPPTTTKKDKKRKNPDDAETPQRAESVKKPKIKLTNNHTPKSNGATPSKAAKSGGETKSAKKAKKPAKEESVEQAEIPKEPEMTAEDRFERKKKEVLFLRHKLQKGLLTKEQQPKEEEMKMMSDYLSKLEGFPDLEAEIIRLTKINKVLKAMLKVDNIPKEEEFRFKPRSQVLLNEWNKTLAADEAAVASAGPDEANGVNGHKKADVKKEEPKPSVNGVKKADTEESEAVKTESSKSEAPKAESKSGVKPEDDEAGETEKVKEAADEESKAVAKKEEAPSTEETKVEEDTKASSAAEAEA